MKEGGYYIDKKDFWFGERTLKRRTSTRCVGGRKGKKGSRAERDITLRKTWGGGG